MQIRTRLTDIGAIYSHGSGESWIYGLSLSLVPFQWLFIVQKYRVSPEWNIIFSKSHDPMNLTFSISSSDLLHGHFRFFLILKTLSLHLWCKGNHSGSSKDSRLDSVNPVVTSFLRSWSQTIASKCDGIDLH